MHAHVVALGVHIMTNNPHFFLFRPVKLCNLLLLSYSQYYARKSLYSSNLCVIKKYNKNIL